MPLPAAPQRGPEARVADDDGRLGGAGAEDGPAPVLDERELAGLDALQQCAGEAAGERLDHEASVRGCEWIGTPLSFSSTAWE